MWSKDSFHLRTNLSWNKAIKSIKLIKITVTIKLAAQLMHEINNNVVSHVSMCFRTTCEG